MILAPISKNDVINNKILVTDIFDYYCSEYRKWVKHNWKCKVKDINLRIYLNTLEVRLDFVIINKIKNFIYSLLKNFEKKED